MSSIIYLRKEQVLEKDAYSYENYETPEECIQRNKSKRIDDQLKRDIDFYLEQLIEIATDTQLAYQWIRKNDDDSKIKFFESLLDENNLAKILNYKRYHFSSYELSSFSDDLKMKLESFYADYISELFEYIVQCKTYTPDFYQIQPSKTLNVYQLDNLINSRIGQGLWKHLGLQPTSTYNSAGINYDGKKEQAYDFLHHNLIQTNIRTNTPTELSNLESLYLDTSNAALDYFVQIYGINGNNKRKGKKCIYQKMTQEELEKKFADIYIKAPKNFLKTLRTYEYKGVLTLKPNNKLIGNVNLVINYLFDKAATIDDRDNTFLDILFDYNGTRKKEIVQYSSEKIQDFDEFLKLHENES